VGLKQLRLKNIEGKSITIIVHYKVYISSFTSFFWNSQQVKYRRFICTWL